jgi:TM2 domain-containing membrane protein YozV
MNQQTTSIQVNLTGKNVIVAYLLWWFLGWAGVHRLYLGRVKTGLAQLLLFAIGVVTLIVLVGYIFLVIWGVWWLLDAFFTYKIVTEENEKLGVLASTLSVSKSGGMPNELDQLEKLHTLYEKGVLTKEEYEAKRAAYL